MNFERVLQKVLWRLVTEGSISYRRIKLSFGLEDDGLEELRRERTLEDPEKPIMVEDLCLPTTAC